MFAWLLKYVTKLETNTLGDYQFITPLDLPIKALMEKLGVKVERKTVKFDFKKKISSSINAHTH